MELLVFLHVFQSRMHWSGMERWLQQRCKEVHPGNGDGGKFKVLGYQWRVLRFNDVTRQSTAKVMAACRENMPGVVYLMQQPHCLAVPCTFTNQFDYEFKYNRSDGILSTRVSLVFQWAKFYVQNCM